MAEDWRWEDGVSWGYYGVNFADVPGGVDNKRAYLYIPKPGVFGNVNAYLDFPAPAYYPIWAGDDYGFYE